MIRWPDSFLNNDITNKSDPELCIDALEAWAIVMAKNPPLKTFGDTMQKIGTKLNIICYPPENLINRMGTK